MIRPASLRSSPRLRPSVSLLAALAAALLLPAGASAQLNVQWVTFKNAPAKLGVPLTALCDGGTEVDFATGDLDKDGWVDVVAVRKQQSSTTGKRTNVLLMNNHGKLEDKTTLYASASDVVGDLGFKTLVNNRDAKIIDLNGDTWPDVVTAPTLSDGDPKAISHPRVYVNLGADGLGHWLGLRHEDARIPQLLTIPGGLPVAPRFCEVAAGDVTGDGAADLYFIDYDGTETGIGEALNADTNDRLLVNDGNGFFTDSGTTRLSSAQLESAFGVKAIILDLNGDGRQDITKDTTLGTPTAVRAFYNNTVAAGPVGFFQPLGIQDYGQGAPYGFDMGSLNGDGLPDLAGADDSADVYRLATGIDPLGKLTWGPLKNYLHASGAEFEFGHNVAIQDLNGDGWGDVMISSVDVDFTGCSGRWHIYHNLGGTVGGDVTLREESELDTGEFGAGWKGAPGIVQGDLTGGYDGAWADFDHDGDLDMLVGSCAGTKYFQNQTSPPVCQTNLGFGGPGSALLSVCGESLLLTSSSAALSLTGAAPSSPLFVAFGLVNNPTPVKGGVLVPVPMLSLIGGLSTNVLGAFNANVPGNSGAPVTVYMQCIVKHGTVYEFSNALALNLGL